MAASADEPKVLTLRQALDSQRRVQALAEVTHRYGATIAALVDTLNGVLPHLDEDERALVHDALERADGQLAATQDALEASLRDLPEGAFSPLNSPMDEGDASGGDGNIES